MHSSVLRIYTDTSVFGGVFDEEFSNHSTLFFESVRSGKFILLTSVLVQQEIMAAPDHIQQFFNDMLSFAEVLPVDDQAIALQQAYLREGIVSEKYSTDALHVAIASVNRADMIVSWNFKHIVHFQKIPLYNAVNTLKRHPKINIYSPLEVTGNEN